MTRGAAAFAAGALALIGGCAHVEAPSGGPEDEAPPALVVTRPDTFAVVDGWDAPAVLVFDERVSERGVRDAVDVSPRTGTVEVDHRGDEIRVRLRGGWRRGVIYHVTVRPQVQDLFGNPLAEPATLVFSTGPPIPDTRLVGQVVDPITAEPEKDVRVEAIRAADSLVYATSTDSVGRFALRRIPEGAYALRSYRDLNRNRRLDPFEPRDSTGVDLAAGDSASRALGLLMPDSTAPVVAGVERVDTATLVVTFDDHLDPGQEYPPAAVQVVVPQGSFAPVAAIFVGDPPPESPGRAPDTAAARVLPSQKLTVRLSGGVRLEPGPGYRLRVRQVRNLVGLVADIDTVFELPEAPRGAAAAGDSIAPDTLAPDTAAARDSAAAADTAARAAAPPRSNASLEPWTIMPETHPVPHLLQGKKGLIVGVANRNSIAWAAAEALAGAGMDLAFTYQGEAMRERVTKTTAELGDVPLFDLDVRDDAQLEAVVDGLRERWGRLDFLLHSVAYAPKDAMANAFWKTTREDFLAAHDISAYSLVGLTRAVEPLMTEGGSVVTMTYYGAEKVVPNYNVMGVAKASLEASVRYLAADLGEKNIRVNAISAGAINTLAARGVAHFRDLLKITADRSPLRRPVEPSEVGNATLFLASHMGSGITGETLYVDAGFNITAG